ncbi:MAG: endonuclease III [Arthrobacter sp.]|jgi:endonuclease-3|nr:endonuclease III [Arthrobacter sp.]
MPPRLSPAQRRATVMRDETQLGKKRRARKIDKVLAETYPYVVAELDFENPFELLVATVLSAQTTDVKVNEVTPVLFGAYPDAFALAGAPSAAVQEIVRPTGFYKTKAANIQELSRRLVTEQDGRVPEDLDYLVTLPGVGRKTAFVVLGNAFDRPGLTVDTHFGRLARRFAWTEQEDPVKVEAEVGELFEKRDYTMLSHHLIFHGRRICHAKKPACGACPVAQWCPSYGEGETDPEAAEALLKYELAPGREELHRLMLEGYTRRQLRAMGHPLGP